MFCHKIRLFNGDFFFGVLFFRLLGDPSEKKFINCIETIRSLEECLMCTLWLIIPNNQSIEDINSKGAL